MNTADAIQRLSMQFPLQQRQNQLDRELQTLHKSILSCFIENGRPMNRLEISDYLNDYCVEAAIQHLVKEDLVVSDSTMENIVGAYPMTLENTPYQIRVHNHTFYAMCALDALAIAPMFDTEIEINSICGRTAVPLHINMRSESIVNTRPSSDIKVGICWQNPCGAAAHSMCMEIVFLQDRQSARQWQQQQRIDASVFDLETAIAIGAGFFKPLIRNPD